MILQFTPPLLQKKTVLCLQGVKCYQRMVFVTALQTEPLEPESITSYYIHESCHKRKRLDHFAHF